MSDPSAGPARPSRLRRLRALLPHVWAILRPRLGRIGLAFLLLSVGRVAGLALPASTKVLVDEVIGRSRAGLLPWLVAGVLAATLLQAGTSWAITELLSKDSQRLVAALRRTLQLHVARLPVAYFDANKTGSLAARIMNDVEGLRNLVGTGLVDLLGGLVASAAALALMLALSPFLTAVTATAVVAFTVLLGRSLRSLGPAFRERGRIYAEVSGRLTESLAGVRVVKGYRAEEREHAVFSAGVGRLLDNVLGTLTAMARLSLTSTLALGLVGAAVMFVGARLVLSGNLTLGGLFTYTMLLGFLVGPLFQVVGVGTQLVEALAGMERMQEVLREQPEDADPRRTVDLSDVSGRFAFEGVSFAYAAGVPVLHDVTFDAEPGTVTALVGPSGAGKSTLIGLVAAFHAPTEGRVLLDGVDLSTVHLDSYRRRLGVVFQETFLFAGTIRENVAFSRPDAPAAEVLGACRLARVDEFAERFPDGYDTVVGERGVKLSGGQRQRVAIARAILADPRVLLLDEATSSLDSESEALIQQALGVLMRGRTTFVIAHRLSTIRRADRILVLDQGRLAESGTHAELLARGGRYLEMYTRQNEVAADLFLAPGEGGPGGPGEAAAEEPPESEAG